MGFGATLNLRTFKVALFLYRSESFVVARIQNSNDVNMSIDMSIDRS